MLNGKSDLSWAGGSLRSASRTDVVDRASVRWSGRGREGDLVAEGLELADQVAGLAGGVDVALVPVGAEFVIAGVGIVDQMPGDDQDGAGDSNDGFGVTSAFDDAARAAD